MAKVQIVFYSMYEGAREVPDTEVSLFQVPELMSDEALEQSGAKAAREAFADVPVAEPAQLAEADAIIFGTPTRFGNMCAQMRNFLDQTGQLWFTGHRRPCRQARQCFRQHRHAARRPGNDDYQLSFDIIASRHDYRRRSLRRTTAAQYGRDIRRHALRRDNPRRSRRLSPADRKRAGNRPLPGQTRSRDCPEALPVI